MAESPPRILPKPTAATAPFWEAAREHRLLLPLTDGGEPYFYPRAFSPGSLEPGTEWVEASGRGVLYSYTVDRRGTAPAFAARAPYVIGIVELEEGPRMTTNIVECAIEDVRIGMAVEAVYEDIDEQVTLVQFRPV